MYRLESGKYTILVDENKLQEDVDNIITTNHVKTNNQREAISTLMNLVQLGTQITNSIFDNLPFTGKNYEEAKQELLSYDTESGRLGYVYIELTDANIKKYNLNNNNLHDIRLQYMRGRFTVLNQLTKKHDMLKSVYDAKALIPRIERALIQDLDIIPTGHPDRDLILEGKTKDIKYCLRCVWR